MGFNFFEEIDKRGVDKKKALEWLMINKPNVANFNNFKKNYEDDYDLIFRELKAGNVSGDMSPISKRLKLIDPTARNTALKGWAEEAKENNLKSEFLKSVSGEGMGMGEAANILLDKTLGGDIIKWAIDESNSLLGQEKPYEKRDKAIKLIMRDIQQEIKEGKTYEEMEDKYGQFFGKVYSGRIPEHFLMEYVAQNPDENRARAIAKATYDYEKKRLEISQKDGKLNKQELQFVRDELGWLSTLFDTPQAIQKDFKNKVKSENFIFDEAQKAINNLKHFHKSEFLLNTLLSDKEEAKQMREYYIKDASLIAVINGFDGANIDREGRTLFYKNRGEGKIDSYVVNTRFWDNFNNIIAGSKFELAGAVAGGLAGARAGKTPLTSLAGLVGGAAIGSFVGAGSDKIISDLYLKNKTDFEEVLHFATQEGLLSAAGDVFFLGGAKATKAAATAAKKLLKGAGVIAEKSVVGSAVKFVGNLPTQNIGAAENVLKSSFSKADEELWASAKKAYTEKTEKGQKNIEGEGGGFLNKALDYLKSKNKENSRLGLFLKNLKSSLDSNDLARREAELISLIRANANGRGVEFLADVAKDDPAVMASLNDLLVSSSNRLRQNIENLNIDSAKLKEIFDEFEAGTKKSYAMAEDLVVQTYRGYETLVDSSKFKGFLGRLQEEAKIDLASLSFLKDLENNLFGSEVTVSKLLGVRKRLNEHVKKIRKSDLGFGEYIKGEVLASLKGEVAKALDSIFKQKPEAYKAIGELYNKSLKDYALMREVKQKIKPTKLQDENANIDNVVDSLIKLSAGQGSKNKSNLRVIKEYIGGQNSEYLELNILKRLLNKAMNENVATKSEVFDSEKFLKSLDKVRGDIFESEKAGELIDLVKGFDALFKNDAKINKLLTPRATGEVRSSIATTLSGAARQKFITQAFSAIFRNLPTDFLFSLFDKNIAGSSLRFHVKRSLLKAKTPQDFIIRFMDQAQVGKFSSKTQEIINNSLHDLGLWIDSTNKRLKIMEEARIKEVEAMALASKTRKEERDKRFLEAAGVDARKGVLNSLKGVDEESPLIDLDIKEKVFFNDKEEPLEVSYALMEPKHLKENLNAGDTQARLVLQHNLIDNIIKDFNADLLLSRRGDLKEGVPIVMADGRILSGNHRIAGLKKLGSEARAKYVKGVSKYFNVNLEGTDYILVRVLRDNDLPKLKRVSILSNRGKENVFYEKMLTSFSNYSQQVARLMSSGWVPDVREVGTGNLLIGNTSKMKEIVGSALKVPEADIESANEALLVGLIRETPTYPLDSILAHLTAFKEAGGLEFSKMLLDNAGTLLYLTSNRDYPFLQRIRELLPYLIEGGGKQKWTSRTDALEELARRKVFAPLQSDDGTFTRGLVSFHKRDFMNSELADILQVAWDRFIELRSPSDSLFEALINFKEPIDKLYGKSLFRMEGKEDAEFNIFDFVLSQVYALVNESSPKSKNAFAELEQGVRYLEKIEHGQ